MLYLTYSGSACPFTPTLCALAPADLAELIKHAISFHTSGPQIVPLPWRAIACPRFLRNSSSHFQLSFHFTFGKPFLTSSLPLISLSEAASYSGEERGLSVTEHWLCRLAVWATHLTPLSLTFLIYQMRILIAPTSQGYSEKLSTSHRVGGQQILFSSSESPLHLLCQ